MVKLKEIKSKARTTKMLLCIRHAVAFMRRMQPKRASNGREAVRLRVGPRQLAETVRIGLAPARDAS